MNSLAEFHFIRPYWLLALIPAIILFTLLIRNKLNQGNWSTVCDPELLPFILQNKAVKQSHLPLSVSIISSILIIFALADPSWERLPSPVFRNDAALVIALDLSRSMDASDIKPSRLSRARFKIADILKQRKDGQTALLVYADNAFTVTPLTNDTETIANQLTALTTEIMPSQGSNAVDAIEKSAALLKQAGLQQGDILLVTDGVDIDNSRHAIHSIPAYRVSILGVGTTEGAPIKLPSGGFVKDGNGNIVVPKLNPQQLSSIASGIYQSISTDNSDIESLFNLLDAPVEKQSAENNNLLIDQWDEKGPYLLLLALPLAALSFRKGLLSLTFICLLPFPENSYAFEWKDLWQTQNQQAQTAFKQENYQQAAEQFDNPQWKAAAQYKTGQYQQALEALKGQQTATDLYNKGNALAQSGKLLEALEAYEQSLQKKPDNEDAKYNKEQVEKALEKQKQQGDNKQQSEQDNPEQQQSKQKQDNNESEQGEQQQNQQEESSEQQEQQDQATQDDNSESSEQQTAENESEPKETDENQEPAPKEAQPQPAEYDESKQASEQWLKRIPDDPAGLLRRKFKYQYGQQQRQSTNKKAW